MAMSERLRGTGEFVFGKTSEQAKFRYYLYGLFTGGAALAEVPLAVAIASAAVFIESYRRFGMLEGEEINTRNASRSNIVHNKSTT